MPKDGVNKDDHIYFWGNEDDFERTASETPGKELQSEQTQDTDE